MIPAEFEYERAQSIDSASAVLRKYPDDAKVIAGGQSLLPLMRLRLSQPHVLVDIGKVRGLNYIRLEKKTLCIGALTRHAELETSSTVRENLPLLAKMASEVGDPQVRNRGTIGGVMAHGDAAGDYTSLALMLDAEIITNKGKHAAGDFFVDLFTTKLAPDELITEVRFPIAMGRHRYLKFRRRLYDWAIVGAAVQQMGKEWRVGLIGVGTTAVRSKAVEQALAKGSSPDKAAPEVLRDIAPRDDVQADAEYKKHLATVLVRRALQEAAA